jgi:hypothetical protein
VPFCLTLTLFLDMPPSAQGLYYNLGIRADDDGFVSSPKKILKITGCTEKDYTVLLNKGLIIAFDSGVCVLTDWKIHNQVRSDRYHETQYIEEKKQLVILDSGRYALCIPNGNHLHTQVRLGKDRSGKDRIGKDGGEKTSNKFGEFGNVFLTDEEYQNLSITLKTKRDSYIEKLSAYMKSKGKKYSSHYATILNWWRKDNPDKENKYEKDYDLPGITKV